MSEVNNQEQQTPELSPTDLWNVQFQGLMKEAQTGNLFAPDILFILQRAVNEIQHQFNSILFTHEHKSTQEGE